MPIGRPTALWKRVTVNLPARFPETLSAVVLAGGLARRMGGVDKALVEVAGRPMIDHVLDRVRPQVAQVYINANRNLGTYARLGVEVIADAIDGYQGPLAGIASVLPRVSTPYLLTTPCDTPLLPADLAARLLEALLRERAEIVVVHDGERQQPVFLLLERSLERSLGEFLASGGRKIDKWFARHRLAEADFSDVPDCFVNVNDPQELARVEALMLSNDARA